MFLIPRLIGVTTYAFCLLTTCYCIRRMKYRDIKIMFGLYLISLSAMGFFYVPYNTADLSRLIPIMHFYTSISKEKFLKEVFGSSTPLVPIYYKCIGTLGYDGLLPAITAFIAFLCCFLILYKNAKRIGAAGLCISAALLVFMSRGIFYQTISDIRSGLSLGIIAYAIYLDKVENKSILLLIPLFLSSAFLHVTGQFVLIYWIAFLLFEPNNRSKIKNFLLGGVLIVTIFVFGRSFINVFIEKGQGFTNSHQSGTGYFSQWESIISIIVIIVVFYCLVTIRKKIKIGDIDDQGIVRLYHFLFPLAILDFLLMFVEFNIFQRLGYFLFMIIGPIIECIIDEEYKSNNKSHYGVFITIGIILLGIVCIRGDLSALKFF